MALSGSATSSWSIKEYWNRKVGEAWKRLPEPIAERRKGGPHYAKVSEETHFLHRLIEMQLFPGCKFHLELPQRKRPRSPLQVSYRVVRLRRMTSLEFQGSCASSLMVDIIPTVANVPTCFVSRSACSILSDPFLGISELRIPVAAGQKTMFKVGFV